MVVKELPLWIIVIVSIICLIAFGFLIGVNSHQFSEVEFANMISAIFTVFSVLVSISSICLMYWIHSQWYKQLTLTKLLDIDLAVNDSLYKVKESCQNYTEYRLRYYEVLSNNTTDNKTKKILEKIKEDLFKEFETCFKELESNSINKDYLQRKNGVKPKDKSNQLIEIIKIIEYIGFSGVSKLNGEKRFFFHPPIRFIEAPSQISKLWSNKQISTVLTPYEYSEIETIFTGFMNIISGISAPISEKL